ncbi:MAG: hypothetical protein AAF989_04985 [Planctomycetota bacterium]
MPRLATPLTMVVQGQTVAQAIETIVVPRQLNVWIDVGLPMHQPLPERSYGPNVISVLNQLMEQVDGELVALADVVLMGRPGWVDETLALIQMDRVGSSDSQVGANSDGEQAAWGPRIEIEWPDLVTPSELLRLVETATPSALNRKSAEELSERPSTVDVLPHDLWPGGRWVDMPRRLAVQLVRARAANSGRPSHDTLASMVRGSSGGRTGGQGNESHGFAANDSADANESNALSWTSRYRTSLSASVLRANLTALDGSLMDGERRDVDRQSGATSGWTLKHRDGWVTLDGRAIHHRSLIQRIQWNLVERKSVARPGAGRRRDGGRKRDDSASDKTFDLKVLNQPAEKLLRTFAGNAGKPIRIEDSAKSKMDVLISFEAKSQSLEQLAASVAEQAGLKVRWDEDEVVISGAE